MAKKSKPDTLKSLRKEIDALKRSHSNLAEQVAELVKAAVSEANSHPQRVEVEPWKPKVGDYIFINDRHTYPPFRNTVVRVRDFHSGGAPAFDHPASVVGTGGDALHDMYRKATSDEITLYKQEVEWAKVSELQHEDQCDRVLSPEEVGEVFALDLPCRTKESCLRSFRCLCWFDDAISGNDAPRADYNTPIPFPEFLRRAKGTAARLKKEAQEKEEAKLEFGTRVTTGVHGTVYRIACFEPDSGGQWRLIRENAGPHSSFLAKRSEFTIKEP